VLLFVSVASVVVSKRSEWCCYQVDGEEEEEKKKEREREKGMVVSVLVVCVVVSKRSEQVGFCVCCWFGVVYRYLWRILLVDEVYMLLLLASVASVAVSKRSECCC